MSFYAKEKKKKEDKKDKKQRGKYDEPLATSGSFLDIIKASAKHADNNSKKKLKILFLRLIPKLHFISACKWV